MGGINVRTVCGGILLSLGAATGVVFGIGARSTSDLVLVEYLEPHLGWAFGLAFVGASVPLLVPQRTPPADFRSNRWYIAVGLWATMLQMLCYTYEPVDRRTLAHSPDGIRSVILYHADGPRQCVRVRTGEGLGMRTAGDIGAAPGAHILARFDSADVIYVTITRTSVLGADSSTVIVRLYPATGRPLNRIGPCLTSAR